MSSAEMEQLTSGASNRIIPILKALRASLIFVYTFFLSFLLFVLPRRRRLSSQASLAAAPSSPRKHLKYRWLIREEEDTFRRRALAQDVGMGRDDGCCRWSTSIFYGVRNNALFCRSWFPVSADLKGILIIIHGLNEHSGRYADFARQLTSCNFGVYAMDWIGHGGSDGLHGYVPSLDHVVADTGAFLEKIQLENPGIPCFLFGHSTGGAVVLKAASHPHIEVMVEGIILTSPALRVKPAHPIVGGLHAAPHELLGSDWPALVRFYKGFTAILLYLALKARKREEGADQLQSFIARKNSRLQNLGKAELLKSKASKITMTHYQKNVKNVTGRKKIKSSSSPFKKRQLERFPPQPSENGNKKLFSLPNHFP